MINFKIAAALVLATLIGACTLHEKAEKPLEPKRFHYANEETQINLQQPFTRVIVKCYSTRYEPAETCAKFFENKGYVRFEDIPYKTANYDFFKRRQLSDAPLAAGRNHPALVKAQQRGFHAGKN